MNTQKKVRHLLIILAFCFFPLFFVCGCGFTNYFSCTVCGDSTNQCGVYADGTENNVEYKSCIGPGGCCGFGLNTCLWPTECLSVSTTEGAVKENGCIYYYDDFGCISDGNSKSNGTYTKSFTCLGCTCAGEEYTEVVADEIVAKSSSSCFGCQFGSENVEPRYLNNQMPRQFENGCCGTCSSENSEEPEQ
jgi:hypothetical protein